MLQERNHGSGHRHDLRRGNVHVLNVSRTGQNEFTLLVAGHEFLREAVVFIQISVRLGDDVLAFLNSGEVVNRAGRDTVNHAAIRRLKEAVVVQAGVNSERVDQTDVRTFRGRHGRSASDARLALRSRRAHGSDRPGQGPKYGAYA